MIARMAVETGSVNIRSAALLASDKRVPQVMSTWPGKIPTSARTKKRRMSFRDLPFPLYASRFSQRISG
jgi:hypothetical protein